MKTNLLRIGVVLTCLLLITKGLEAQWQQYKAAYPEWPFSIEQVIATGNNKCSVWKSTYQKAEGDESGQVWMTPILDAHQYQRYQFSDGKPALVSTYLPSGNKLETMEYFYRDNLLSAIEVLMYDSLQESKVKYALQYLYHKENDAPAQRTKIYGPPNTRVRVLDEFEFDEQYRLVRQKSTVVGFSPYMDSLLGLQANEKQLISAQYEDSIQTKKIFKDLHLILDDRKTFLDANKRPILTEVRNAKGQKLWTIDYDYEGDKLVKKTYWVRRPVPIAQEAEASASTEKGKKKIRKTNKNKQEESKQVLPPTKLLDPAIYKVEYFRYNADGLLEQHLIEEGGQQIVLEYSYFME